MTSLLLIWRLFPPALAPERWTAIIVASVGALGVIGAAAIAFLSAWLKVRGDKASLQQQLAVQERAARQAFDERIDERVDAALNEACSRIDLLEAGAKTHQLQMGAVARIFRAIATQWPGAQGGPDLDPADISLIEDTIPPHWIRRGTTPKE